MRGSGRSPPSAFGLLPRLLCLTAHLAFARSSDYGVPIEIKLWDTGRTPLAHMVDVTNGFGLKVLAEHNFLNDNNIAFSPYGLMGILVALYEGVDGESSFQIQRGMQLPWNRNVMRIGFRDIHRTLKTYFVPEEGFLAGLALNNENVTFNDNYKKILRFYGFDLENEQLPTFAPGSNNATNETSTTATAMDSPDSATTVASAESTTSPTTTTTESSPNREELSTTTTTPSREETTLNPNAETVGDVDLREPTTTTISSAVVSNADTSSTSEQPPLNTEQATTTTIQQTTITTPITTTEQADTVLTTTETITTVGQTTTTEQITSTVQTTLQQSETTATEQVTTTLTTTVTSIPNAAETNPITTTEASTVTASETTVAQTSTMISEPTSNNELDTMTTREMSTADTTVTDSSTATTGDTGATETDATSTTETTEQMSESSTTSSTLETLERRKKSVVDFIFTNPPYVDDYLVYKSYDINAELPPIELDDHNRMFLANGLRNVQVTYMHYDTILEHAYLPHLEASALRLPLDSDRYYLLVVLPSRGGVAELGRLLARMARESDLSDVYAALRPRRVRALVPSFTVKGHVTLTTDLQKLGIRDVFEPRQRDFTPMTRQSGVYVRSIEQAVSVAIRKYRPDDQKKNRYVNNRQPVKFRATYPFLYFVMDSSIHVALMAGKMVDPLNNRIL